MPTLIDGPRVVESAGNPPKRIEEYYGWVSTADGRLSLAKMSSPAGWREPGQRPDFLEITLVLEGMVRIEHDGGVLEARAGQSLVAEPGEWVRYSTPETGGARYVAVCLPAFAPDIVHRDDDSAGG